MSAERVGIDRDGENVYRSTFGYWFVAEGQEGADRLDARFGSTQALGRPQAVYEKRWGPVTKP